MGSAVLLVMLSARDARDRALTTGASPTACMQHHNPGKHMSKHAWWNRLCCCECENLVERVGFTRIQKLKKLAPWQTRRVPPGICWPCWWW